MPGITDPAEEYFKDGLWAWDPAGGVWLKLIIDPLTNRLVIDHPGDIEVVQPVSGDLCVANHGWDGSAWRKLPLVFGYSDRYLEKEAEANVAAGTHSLTFTTVPAGEIWVIQSFTGRCKQNTLTGIQLVALGDATGAVLKQCKPALAGDTVGWSGDLVLKEDDGLMATFLNCALNDDIYSEAWGYKMLIAE